MPTTRAIHGWWELPAALRETPFQTLLEFQNLGRPGHRFDAPRLAIIACMDARVRFRVPEGFAADLRTAGGALEPLLFSLAYVISTKGIRHVAVVGHTNCGGTALLSRRREVIDGLRAVGVDSAVGAALFDDEAPRHTISDPAEAAFSAAARVRSLFPAVTAAAFLYDTTGDGTLSAIEP